MIRTLFTFLTDPGPTVRFTSPIAKWTSSLALVAGRLWLGCPFANAGCHRLVTWDAQEFLFTEVHPVPFLPASIAAPLTTGAELALGFLLLAGLGGRVGALGLAVMSAALYFVIGHTPQGEENGIAIASEQIPWIIIGLALFLTGPGMLSIDAIVKRFGFGARPAMTKS